MERMNAYSMGTERGGVRIDIEGMMVDLVTACKCGGFLEADFIAFAQEVFRGVTVNVKVPEREKN